MRTNWTALLAAVLTLAGLSISAAARAADDATLPTVDQRFADATGDEIPDFQRHVSPLFGRLGCNGRSCHGSFQGQGGFRLSLFGYDFQADLDSLNEKGSPRIDVKTPAESLILVKPTDADMHEGGERYKKNSWQYQVLHRWIEGGAQLKEGSLQQLVQLEVTPNELLFTNSGQQVQLRAVAVWEDGTREDVTPLCRFQSNSDQVALIDEHGAVTSADPGDTHLVISYDNAVVAVPVLRPVSNLVGDKYPDTPTANQVDELVLRKLRKLGLAQSELATDAEFLRRVSLDMTGTLPTAVEVTAFLADAAPDKRGRKIDELLESPAYAAWWATRLCDFTGNNEQQIQNAIPQMRGQRSRASQDWYDWIHKRVADNTPYDDLTAGIVLAKSREPEQSYTDYCKEICEIYRGDHEKSVADLPSMPYYWAKTELRVPEARTIAFSYSFLGIRIQCAQCHKHPFDQWSKQDFEQFTNFFRHVQFGNGGPANRNDRDSRREYDAIVAKLNMDDGLRGNQIRQQFGLLLGQGKTVPFPELAVVDRPITTRGDMAEPLTTPLTTARLLGGETFTISEHQDIREPLMQWLRSKDNPYFARAFVNRVWAAYFNVGIVEPPDDVSLANPPSNKELLDHLSDGFIDSGFDMKWVHREIANSRTYQLSWRPNDTNGLDERNFARAVPRRLPAEVVYDAIAQATAADEKAAEMRTSVQGRAISIAGASNRNANQGPAFALSVFGKSQRESNCDCDRSNESSLLQTVFLQNDGEMLRTLDRGDGWIAQLTRGNPPAGVATAANRPANYPEQIAQLESRVRNMRRTGGNSERLKQAEQRLAQFKARFGDLDKGNAKAAQPAAASDTDQQRLESLVQQAYLRSVSRLPDERELGRSIAHVRESENPMDGLKDVLWALINTKEFIVNH